MPDRYTKAVLTVIAVALAVLALRATLDMTPPARADPPAPPQRICEWSYVWDAASPNLGEGGKVSMDADWTAMSQGGWELKVVDANTKAFVFERCR